MFRDAVDGDEVTVTVPAPHGRNHFIFTFRDDGRWHHGTVDVDGRPASVVWAAYVRARNESGATIRRGGPQLTAHGPMLPASGEADV